MDKRRGAIFVSTRIDRPRFGETEQTNYKSQNSKEGGKVVGIGGVKSTLVCSDCGISMIRLGSCFSCPSCGHGGCN